MIRHLVLATVGAAAALVLPLAAEADWFFQPARYTHDSMTGGRVAQYAAKPPAFAREVPNYVESGYRHTQSRIRGADGSADRTHVVQTWGQGELIRPYGEWLRPFREGATPYGPWGNPRGPWTLPFDSWMNPYGLWNRGRGWGGPWWGGGGGVGPVPYPGGPMGGPAYAQPGIPGEPGGPAYGGAYRTPGG